VGAQVLPRVVRPFSVLVVDDERIARVGLRAMLEAHAELRIVGEAATGEDAARAMRRLKPDIVYLDVQMPDCTGLDLLERWPAGQRPAIVFVTAYPEYALDAFGFDAVDYLLKPFTPERIAESIRRVIRHLRGPHGSDSGTAVAPSLAVDGRRLSVRRGDRLYFVEPVDVEWLEVYGNYLRVAVRGRFFLLRATLGELKARLDPTAFVRISRSVTVNIRHVQSARWLPTGQCEIAMTAGVRLTSSRRYRREVRSAFTGLQP